MMKGVNDNDDDDHEHYHYHCYRHHDHDHHHHHYRHHYHHISSIGYVILTLHLNQNHLGTSCHILVSLRKDLLMKDFIFLLLNHKIN